MQNHHLAVCVFISNMPQSTTKGCRLNKVLDKQLVVHNCFFTPTKKRPQLMISGALPTSQKKVGGKQPLVQKKELLSFPSLLLFSSVGSSTHLPLRTQDSRIYHQVWMDEISGCWEVLGDLIGFIQPSKIATPTRSSRYHNKRLSLN